MLSLLYKNLHNQPFNVVGKPNKFYYFYIDQQATNEKMVDFYENINALEHFLRINRSANI